MLGLAAATEIETASLPALAGEPADAAAPGWSGAAGAATQRPEPIVILDQASGNAAAADPHPPGEIAVLPLAAATQDSEPEPGAPLLTAGEESFAAAPEPEPPAMLRPEAVPAAEAVQAAEAARWSRR